MELQLFAGERTEEASPQKLADARKEGRATRSADLMAGIGLVAATIVLQNLGSSIFEALAGGMAASLAAVKEAEVTPDNILRLIDYWMFRFARAALPLTASLAVIGTAAGLIQSKLLISWKPVTPQWERISPLAGLKRIFSLKTLVEQVKGLLKLAIVGYVIFRYVQTSLPAMPNLMGETLASGVTTVAGQVIGGLQQIGYGLLALGLLDYGYQYWEFTCSVKMTKEEVKKEHKEQEGTPEIKQKQRQRQREMARRRKALQEVPGADVVITNPTHFAVALKYIAEEGPAPKVVAKGADILAQRIKLIARSSQVPMVENRPLARALHESVEVGTPIPAVLYQAVAEVLAYVYSLRRQQRR